MAREPNVHGRAQAFTVLTRLRPGGRHWLRLNFFVGRHVALTTRALRKLSLIHYARWGIVRLKAEGNDYLLVTSNFNGTWDEYIEIFSEIVPWRITAIWATSYGFAGASRADALKRFARGHELTADHYYAAYPHATTKLIESALALRAEWDEFAKGVTADCEAEHFRSAWMAFLTRAQRHL